MTEYEEMWTGSDIYICDPDLAAALDIAIKLKKPLLLEGEPGTGKTELAIQYAQSNGLALHVYPVTSASTVKTLLGDLDSILRLMDSQGVIQNAQLEMAMLRAKELHMPDEYIAQLASQKIDLAGRRVSCIDDYVTLGPLARAFEEGGVLLIDEIDKAPREFPNDLLYVLDRGEYTIPGTTRTISNSKKPVIVITSNREQALPNPFLRRCIYHEIQFPDAEGMKDIVEKHYPTISADVCRTALDVFYQLRTRLKITRAPSTSELLDWLRYVGVYHEDDPYSLNKLPGGAALIKDIRDMSLLREIQRESISRVNSTYVKY